MRIPPCRGALVSFCLTLCAASTEARQTQPGDAFQEGWRWTTFDASSGLPSEDVRELVEVDGTPYVATSEGVATYDGWRWHDIGVEQGLPREEVLTLTAAPDDSLWVSTRSGLFVREAKGFRAIPAPEGLGAHLPLVVAHAADGTTFVCYAAADFGSQGIYALRAGAWSLVETPPTAGLLGTATLWPSRTGSAWITSKGTAHRYVDGTWQEHFDFGAEPWSTASTFFEATEGAGLFGVINPVEDRGLYRFDAAGNARRIVGEGQGIAQFITVSPEGHTLVVYDTLETRLDAEGVWSDVRVDPEIFSQVTFVGFRPDGDLWVGTRTGLHLLRRSLSRWSRLYHEGFNDPRNRINELFVSTEGQLWTAHSTGVEVRTLRGSTLPVTLPEQQLVTGIGQDRAGVVWVSSGSAFGGLHGWTGSEWRRLEDDVAGRPLGLIHKIRADTEGTLWLLSLAAEVGSTASSGSGPSGGPKLKWRAPASARGSSRRIKSFGFPVTPMRSMRSSTSAHALSISRSRCTARSTASKSFRVNESLSRISGDNDAP